MASESIVVIWNRALSMAGSTALLSSDVEVEGGGVEGEQCRLHHPAILKLVLGAYPWPHAMMQRAISQIDTNVGALQPGDNSNKVFQVDIDYRDTDALTVEVVTEATGAAVELDPDTDYAIDEDEDPPLLTLDASVTAPTTAESVRVTAVNERMGFAHVYDLPADCVRPLALLADGERISLLQYDARHPFRIMSNDDKDGQVLCTDLDTTDFEVLEYTGAFASARGMPADFEEALVWRLASALAEGLTKDPNRAKYCLDRFTNEIKQAYAGQLNAEHQPSPDVPTIAARG